MLMRRLARRRATARRRSAVYEELRAALRRDLAMAPSAETRALRRGAARRRRPSASAARRCRTRSRARGPRAARRPARRARGAAGRVAAGERGRGGRRGGRRRGRRGQDPAAHRARRARSTAAGATVLAGRCFEDGVVAFAPFTEALRPYAARAARAARVGGRRARPPAAGARRPSAAEPAGDPHGRPPPPVRGGRGGDRTRRPRRARCCSSSRTCTGRTPRRCRCSPTCSGRSGGRRCSSPARCAEERRRHGAARAAGRPAARAAARARGARRALGRTTSATSPARGWARRAPPALAAAVHRRTGGNPLFVEELVRHLVESHPPPAEALVAAAATELPHGVHAVIDRRLAPPRRAAGRAVRVAAVAGEEFALADVAAVGETRDDAVAEALDAAVAAGLVDEAAAPGRYRFAHALVREAVLARLTATRRALLHRRHRRRARGASRRPARLGELARHLLDARPLVDAATAARGGAARRRAARCDGSPTRTPPSCSTRAGDVDPGDATAARRGCCSRSATRAQRSGRRRRRPGAASSQAAARGARARRRRAARARGARAPPGWPSRVGPVRDEVRALLEEALAGVDARLAAAPAAARPAGHRALLRAPATLRERLSEEALDGGRRRRRPRAARGARRPPRRAVESRAHVEERLAIADELVAAARAGGRPRGRAAGRQLARRRPRSSSATSPRRGPRSTSTSGSPASCACSPTPGTSRCGGRRWRCWRVGSTRRSGSRRRASGSGRPRTTTTPRCSSQVQRLAIRDAAGDADRRGRGPRSSSAPGARRPAPRGGSGRWRMRAPARRRTSAGAGGARGGGRRSRRRCRSTRTGSTRRRRSASLARPLGDARRRRRRLSARCCPTRHRIVTVGRASACVRGSVALSLGPRWPRRWATTRPRSPTSRRRCGATTRSARCRSPPRRVTRSPALRRTTAPGPARCAARRRRWPRSGCPADGLLWR